MLLVLCAAILWSSAGLLVRFIDTDEPTMIFWRSVFAFLALSGYLLYVHRGSLRAILSRLGGPAILVAALLGADAASAVFAFNHTSVANVMIIFSITPFVAAGVGWLWLRERASRATWTAAGVCMVGVVIMVSNSSGVASLTGDFFAFISVLVFAVGVVALRRFQGIDVLIAVWLSSALSALMFLPFATPFGHAASDYALLAFFGGVEYALALVCFTLGARLVPAAQSSLILLMENVLGPVSVWLAINEIPGPYTLAGGALIGTTLVVYILRELRVSQRA